MGAAETSSTIWRLRELLTQLLFKLRVEGLLLAAGETRWLGTASQEVALVLDRVREAELLRGVEVDVLAAELGLPPGPTLAQLVDALAPPWNAVFAEHRSGLVGIAAEIDAAARHNRSLLAAGERAVAAALAHATGPTRTGPARAASLAPRQGWCHGC